MRSRNHNVAFLVGIDDDDQESLGACVALAKEMPLEWRVRPRPRSLGTIHNALLAEMVEADLVTAWMDRAHCLTIDWDSHLAQTSLARPGRVLWWSSPHDNGCTLPIWPKSYLAAAGYRWTPEIFPFWFDDVWLWQVERLVHGGPAIQVEASYGTQRDKTTRGRDFAFWGTVFDALMPARIAEAQAICNALNVPWQERPELMEEFDRDAAFFASKAAIYEEIFGDGREPGPEYLAAKAAAERFLATAG